MDNIDIFVDGLILPDMRSALPFLHGQRIPQKKQPKLIFNQTSWQRKGTRILNQVWSQITMFIKRSLIRSNLEKEIGQASSWGIHPMPPNHIREALGDSAHHSFAGSFRWSFGLKPLGVHDTFFVLKKSLLRSKLYSPKPSLAMVL